MAEEIVVGLRLDTDGVVQGFKKIEQTATTFKDIFKGSFLGELAADAVKAGVRAFTGMIKEGIQESINYDNALKSMNMAMAASGKYSEEASRQMVEFANSIEETTKFGDELVLTSVAMLHNMTRLSNDGVKVATNAALDLASAFNIDLEKATRMVGQAANGNIAAFSKLGIQIQKGTTDAETYANTLKVLSQFQGSAEKSANTYEGALVKMGNAWGDVQKSFAKYLTRSPALISAFNSLAKGFGKISEFMETRKEDVFKDFLISAISFTKAILYIGTVIKTELELPFLRFSEMATKFGSLFSFGKQADVMKAHLEEIQGKIKAISDRNDKEFDDNPLIKFLDESQDKISQTSGALKELKETIDKSTGESAEESGFKAIEFQNSVLDNFKFFGMSIGKVRETTIQEMERMKSVALSVGQMINQAFTKVAVDGIQRLTKTLISGKSAFHDFGGFILKTMGELATQIGTFLISAGIGMLALKNLSAAQAIVAGAALVALGTILSSSISEGGGSMAAGGTGSVGASPAFSPDVGGDVGLDEIQQRKPETNISVNIQGNVLDRRQTGLEIAEVIQETFGSNGINYSTA